jgi:hypothetical protein
MGQHRDQTLQVKRSESSRRAKILTAGVKRLNIEY